MAVSGPKPDFQHLLWCSKGMAILPIPPVGGMSEEAFLNEVLGGLTYMNGT